MTVLDLVVTNHWFDEIKSGRKTHEYREIKPYWDKRLAKQYDVVRFRRGYTDITASYKLVSISITNEQNDLNLSSCYDIEFSECLDANETI